MTIPMATYQKKVSITMHNIDMKFNFQRVFVVKGHQYLAKKDGSNRFCSKGVEHLEDKKTKCLLIISCLVIS